jgi:hypothetical protein
VDPREYAKAIIAALGAGLTAFTAAQVAGKVTTAGWVTIAVATVTTGLTVFVVPNRPPEKPAKIEGVPS